MRRTFEMGSMRSLSCNAELRGARRSFPLLLVASLAAASSVTSSAQAAPVCVTVQRGTQGNVSDSYIAGTPTDLDNNYGARGTMMSGGGPRYALIRFDLSFIPITATVDTATVKLYEKNTGAAAVNAHRITAAWAESTVTWNSFGSAFDPMIESSFLNGGKLYNGPITFSLTELVQAWVDGSEQNHGVLLEESGAPRTTYQSSESILVNQRPSLEVCYQVPDPVPPGVLDSCSAHLAASPSATSGLYWIDPDGAGPMPEFQAWCDQTTDGGGWMLALRVQSAMSVFADFYSPYWTDATLLNNAGSADPTLDVDAKFEAFTDVAGTEIRGCLKDPSTGAYGCKSYAYGGTRTLRAVFDETPVGSDLQETGGLFFVEPDEEKMEWLTMWGQSMANASTGAGYTATGINLDDDASCWDARVRFGLALNNEGTIWTLNDTAGFGASAHYDPGCDPPETESGWRVGAGFVSNQGLFTTQGTVWVR